MKELSQPVFGLFILISLGSFSSLRAQMITGVWKGRMNRQKVELKIVQNGDSLTGTSYYYESANNYRRYSIRGYFDPATNAAVWWDDQVLDEKSGRFSLLSPGKIPLLARADFNCPGSGKMMLDGKTAKKEDELKINGEVHLDKTDRPQFEDEWDFVIDNYTTGANDPDLIDSIAAISEKTPPADVQQTFEKPAEEKIPVASKPDPVISNTVKTERQPAQKPVEPKMPQAIEEKFTSREKIFVKEIPLAGDSVELRFYDNAEIDGDSISLFLNDKLLFQHIRLTGNAFIIRLSTKEMNSSNELTMVAENLGSIPPNTAYMVAIINDIRYDAYLASSEGSSAMIRFTKK